MSAPDDQASRVARLLEKIRALPCAEWADTLERYEVDDAVAEVLATLTSGVDEIMEAVIEAGLEEARAVSSADLPSSMGDYHEITKLPHGDGAHGIVCQARQRNAVDRLVAIKLIRLSAAPTQAELDAVDAEVRAQAPLLNEAINVIPLIDVVRHDQWVGLVMGLAEGGPLGKSEWLRKARADPEWAIGVVIDVAAGAQAAFQLNFLHRDIKPANILMTANGVAKLADFSLSSPVCVGEEGRLVARRGGTPPYMSPAQLRGEDTPKNDVYSLAVTAVEIMAGPNLLTRIPDESASPQNWKRFRRELRNEFGRPYRAYRNNLSAVLVKALQPSVRLSAEEKSRYDTTGAFAERLKFVRDRRPIDECFDPAAMVSHQVRMHPRASVAAAAMLLTLLLTFLSILSIRSARDLRRAVTQIEEAEQTVLAAEAGPKAALDRWNAAADQLKHAAESLERFRYRTDLVRKLEDLNVRFERGRAAAEAADKDAKMIRRLLAARLAPAWAARARLDYDAGARAYADAFSWYLGEDVLRPRAKEELDSKIKELTARMVGSPIRRELAAAFADWMTLNVMEGVITLNFQRGFKASQDAVILKSLANGLGQAGSAWEKRFYAAFVGPAAALNLRNLANERNFGESPTSIAFLGRIVLDSNVDEAVDYLREAQKIHQRDLWINYYLCIGLLEKAKTLSKNSMTPKVREEAKKLVDESLVYALTAESQAPDGDPRQSVVISTLLGAIYADTGRTDLAIELWRRVVKRWPQASNARANLLRLLLNKKSPPSAVVLAEVDELIDGTPPRIQNEPIHLLNLAEQHLAHGRARQAVACYSQVLDTPLNGFDSWEYLNYARALIEIGDVRKAQWKLQFARGDWPDEVAALLEKTRTKIPAN